MPRSQRERLEGRVEPTLPLHDLTQFQIARSEAGIWPVTSTERRALLRYRVSSRGTNAPILEASRQAAPKSIRRWDALDSALAKAPRVATRLTVYRGERHPRTDYNDGYRVRPRKGTFDRVPDDYDGLLRWAKAQWPIGEVIMFGGYASFAATPAVAMRFTANEPSRPATLFRTTTRLFSHSGLLHASHLRPEYDILLPRQTTAIVEGVSIQKATPPPWWWGRFSLNNSRPKSLLPFVVIDLALPASLN